MDSNGQYGQCGIMKILLKAICSLFLFASMAYAVDMEYTEETLNIYGGIRISSAPTTTDPGTMRFQDGVFQIHDDNDWITIYTNTYDYTVTISSPYALGTTTFTIISPYRIHDVTISTISVHCIGGTNCVISVTQRDVDLDDGTDGTVIWSSDVTGTSSGWTGGTASDFTIPANSALAIKIKSVSGDVDRLVIKYRITVD